MAAKIIKGGGDGGAHRAPAGVRTPQVVGAGKVIDREVYSARNKAEGIGQQAQQEAAERKQRAEQQANDAFENARAEASDAARLEAVTAILRAYKARGDALMSASAQCFDVATMLLTKITGGHKPDTPREVGLGVIERALFTRRGRFSAVIALPPDDIAALRAHGPLVRALQAAPELKLEEADEGLLSVAGGEIPLDLATAARALCDVLEVPMPASLGGEAQDAAPDDDEEEHAKEEADEPVAEEEPQFEEEEEEAAAAPDEEDGAVDEPQDEELEAAQEAEEDVPPPVEDEEPAAEEEEDEWPGEVTNERPEPAPRSPPPVTGVVERRSFERSVVTSARAVPLPNVGRPQGTRVDIGTSGRGVSRIGAPPAAPSPDHSGAFQAIGAEPRHAPIASFGDDDENAATMAVMRPRLDDPPPRRPPPSPASRPNTPRPAPPPPPGTRVDVRPLPRKPPR